MCRNKENKLSERVLLSCIEEYLSFFQRKRFDKAEEISWRLSELSKLPSNERGDILAAVFFRLNKASGRYHEGRDATKIRLEGVGRVLEEALSKAEAEAAKADDSPPTPGPSQSKTPTWPYGLFPPEEPVPPKAA